MAAPGEGNGVRRGPRVGRGGAADPAMPTSPWRSAGLLTAAAFVVLVAGLAATVIVTSADDARPSAGSAAPTAAAPHRMPHGMGAGGECAPSDTADLVPEAAPADVSWSLFGGVAVPASRSAGPLIVRGGLARCYAHTPTGALLAAWNISTRYLIAPDWRAVTLGQVAPGPGREAYLRLRATAGSADSGAPPGEATSGYGQLSAFRFTAYTPALAVVQVVTRGTSGQLQSYALTVVWDPAAGGDWKLALQPDGAPSTPAQPVTDLDGFIPWSGV